MGEQNRCIRCGKPCAPNETMCDECKAWFQSQTGKAPGKVKVQTKEPQAASKPVQADNPPKEKAAKEPKAPKAPKEKTPMSKNTMILIGVAAAVIIVAVIVIALVKGKKPEDKGKAPVKQQEAQNQQEPKQEEPKADAPEQEDKIWESADIDGTDEKLCTLYGTVEGGELKLDSIQSVFVNDEMGQKYFFKEAEYIAFTEVPGDVPLEKYHNHQVEVKGTLVCADEVIYVKLLQIETTDGPIAEENAEEGIHLYDFIVKDCSWMDAFAECMQRGGHLVRINSQEEYDYILQKIAEHNLDSIHFYLGGRRNAGEQGYFWADENNQLYGDELNSMNAWCAEAWFAGEPSYEDPELHIDEAYLNMFYLKREGRFVWADAPNDIPSAVPAFRGKVGFIIEYDN